MTALRGYGFAVEVLEGLTRPVDEPDNIDYDKVSTDADAILHLWISEVGVPDAKFAYPSFEAVMSNIDDVRSAFAIGAVEIGKRMSEQIYSTVNSRADVRAAESLLGAPAGRLVASSREP